MQKWSWLCLLWISAASAQSQLESDVLYLQQQVSQLRQTLLEQDAQIAQQNIVIQQLRGELELLEHKIDTLNTQKQAVIVNEPIVNKSENDKQAYQKIYLMLEVGDDEQAINGFREFLALYPNSQFADDAQYWLAEAYYSKRDFISALVAYESFLERFTSSTKRAQVELKIGYCYHELQDFVQAKKIFTEVKNKYPNQSIARLASKKLAEIKPQ